APGSMAVSSSRCRSATPASPCVPSSCWGWPCCRSPRKPRGSRCPSEVSAMSVPTPDWLARHGGELRANPDGESHAVYFGPELEYVLRLVPAQGKYTCRVKQTINGKHLESGTAHP